MKQTIYLLWIYKTRKSYFHAVGSQIMQSKCYEPYQEKNSLLKPIVFSSMYILKIEKILKESFFSVVSHCS